ncbi:MAG TPA: thermonuclease family protein [Gemmatimonadales bacterium]|nr:thermonuclease family protein [Gemmatimonadales bacterium]
MRLLPLLLLALPLPLAAQGAPARRSSCTVERIIDGDTFVCAGKRHVRMLLIDAPEHGQHPAGDSAKAVLSRLLPRGAAVTLELAHDSLDRYGRTLAYVWVGDSALVNAEIVRSGWAVVELYGRHDQQYLPRLRVAEQTARYGRRGWWKTGEIACRPRRFRRHLCRGG